jgi:hypothetical protein
MRATLKKYFTSATEHHTAMARLAESAMNSCEEDSEQHGMYKAAMDAHINHAECCAECAKSCGKADGDDLEKIIMPSQVSGIVPNAPGIRAVPRAGQREMPTGAIDADFAHLAQVEGGE